jgi:ubiquinol oxidase
MKLLILVMFNYIAVSYSFQCMQPTIFPRPFFVSGSVSGHKKRSVTRFATNPKEVSQVLQRVNENVLNVAKYSMDSFYGNRSIARFYALETVARMPFFAYASVLHLYETFGWFRKSIYSKEHFEENWNELYHLKIMEQLGGDKKPLDRVVAQSASLVYFWFTILLYMVSPATAYNLSKQVEDQAYKSYSAFIDANEEYLRSEIAPPIAQSYYIERMKREAEKISLRGSNRNADDKSSTNSQPTGNASAASITLYDVFTRIRDDEQEHAGNMEMLQRAVIQGKDI